jgi:radical SAM protein with 4Fe4S-binding SPASM domain
VKQRFGETLADLAWIDEFVARIRQYVRVRAADGVLIKMPLEVTKLNDTGVRLLGRALDGAPIEKIARECGAAGHPERVQQIHAFFCDVRDLLAGRLGDGSGRRATRMSRFTGSVTKLPVLSEIALTYRCNLSCSFCYAGCGEEPPGEEMSTAEALRIIDILATDAQVPSVSFTGGEATLRRDLPELIARAKDRDLRVNLITNGVRCASRRYVRVLIAAGLDSAQVSVEGPDAAVHDGLTGHPGSFERTLAGLRNLRDEGLSVHTHTTISRPNADRLHEIVDLAAAHGLPRLSMNLIIPTGTPNRPEHRGLRVSYSEVGPLATGVRDYAEARGLEFHWYSPTPFCVFNPIAQGLGNKGCAACDGLIHVSPVGDVLPCSSWDRPVGNLLTDGFRKVWSGPRATFHREKRHAPEHCAGCEDFALCQGACPLYWEACGTAEIAPPQATEEVRP